jgi:hypothetical protein
VTPRTRLARLKAGADGVEQLADPGAKSEEGDERRNRDAREDQTVLDQALSLLTLRHLRSQGMIPVLHLREPPTIERSAPRNDLQSLPSTIGDRAGP